MIKSTESIKIINVYEMDVKQLKRGGAEVWETYFMRDVRFIYNSIEYRLFDRKEDIILVSFSKRGGEVVYFEKEGNKLQFSNISDEFREKIKEALDYDLMPSLF